MGYFSKIKIRKLKIMSIQKCNRDIRDNEGGKNAERKEEGEGRRASWVAGTIDGHTTSRQSSGGFLAARQSAAGAKAND